jgi:hypothetical protein
MAAVEGQDMPEQTRKTISSLEADLAYFDARLSLIGDAPATIHQKAQIKAFTTLGKLLRVSLAKHRAAARRR